MDNIAVVTDSTATIHQETMHEYGIHVAPLHINWDKVKYRDGIDITPKEFYERLRTSVTLPTTSGAIVAEFLQIFEGLRGKADGIVTIVLSKELSAVYNSLMTAKEMVSDMAIEAIDSKLSTMAMGFAVVASAKVAAAGGSMPQVIKAARDVMAKAHLFFALDNLDYLRRGGRVNMPAAVIANLLKVKPVLTLKDGKVEPVAKPRTKPRAIETLLNLMKERVKDTPLHVDVMHADDRDAAENLRREISLRFHCAELLITDFTPVMGSHTGPNALGVAFYND
jgi:DegV family protein with EDD domain